MCGWRSEEIARASRFEALAQLSISREDRRQDLDRDAAIQPWVAGAIDLAHPAGATIETIS